MHRVYRTPAFLLKIGVQPDAKCPRCSFEPADLMHTFWNCVPLGHFWNALISYLNQVFEISIPKTPLLCVLGVVEDSLGDDLFKITLRWLLYQARKLIAAHWLSPCIPTQKEFLAKIQYIIRMESGVYLKRRAISKFEKIWGKWMAAHGISFSN